MTERSYTNASSADPSPPISSAIEAYRRWVAGLPREAGVLTVSPARRFAHDESAYDAQYGWSNDAVPLEDGRGLVELCRAHGGDFEGPALEFGCGTGLLSAGLVAARAYPAVMLTDPSPAFLGITREKLRLAGMATGAVDLAVLSGEDVDHLPPAMFSLIAMRSTLHHIVDVPAFIAAAARGLRPGGILAFEEPLADGFILAGALAQFLPLVASEAGRPLTKQQREQVRLYCDTMLFYARRDVDKREAEDKHVFRPAEIMRAGDDAGLSVRFHTNAAYVQWVPERRSDAKPGAYSFRHAVRDYLKYCMNFGDSLTDLIEGPFARYCDFVETLTMNGDGPAFTGVFACRKR